MAKASKKPKQAASGEQGAVLDLRMDSSTPATPREVAQPAEGGFQTPCTVTGLMAGLSGGSLGYVFGFGGYWIRHLRGGGKWSASLAEGWGSAKTFGVMGGLYAAVSCIMLRLRQKNDAWNGAASGCATGLALGWKQGPAGALQSCALLGAFSFFVDGMGGGQAEAAAAAGSDTDMSPCGTARVGGDRSGSNSSSGSSSASLWEWLGQRQQQQQGGCKRSLVEELLSPAVPLLAAVAPCAFGGAPGELLGTNRSSSSPAGCRIVRRTR